MSLLRPGSHKSGSRLSWLFRQSRSPMSEDTLDHDNSSNGTTRQVEIRPQEGARFRLESSLLGASFSSSVNQQTPARSYYQRSFAGTPTPVDVAQHTAYAVREDTEQLASYALSDAASTRSRTPPSFQHNPASGYTNGYPELGLERNSFRESPLIDTFKKQHAEPIQEVSEPVSPETGSCSQPCQATSNLTEQLRHSSTTEEPSSGVEGDISQMSGLPHEVVVRNGYISQPHERMPLLNGRSGQKISIADSYGMLRDIESLEERRRVGQTFDVPRSIISFIHPIFRRIFRPKTWDRRPLQGVRILDLLSLFPAVTLGLLLNILDALSYGMILFPTAIPVFAGLEADGLSIFYVSCIVSQLVFSLGGSMFKGGIGSELIEVVPFFHQMASTTLAQVGEDNSKSVLATTVVCYSLSSIITGIVFYAMGRFKLGSLIGFFPRHILLGCIGGVGWFLFVTGIEVSAGLNGGLKYSLATLYEIFQLSKVFFWTGALALAVFLIAIKHWVKHALTDAIYFMSALALFYFFVAALPNLSFDDLRARGLVFPATEASKPWYHFYTLFDFREVNWSAVGSTIPIMLALTFFSVLHVPINIPALALITGEDNADLDRELRAHGWSNTLSGLCGSVQNYLVYTNTVLFMRSGGDSRTAGALLAIATFGVLSLGTQLPGYIPKPVVAALIFFLAIELLKEALVTPWRKAHHLEYITIIIIIIAMSAWDFVVGILVGIVLACINFVLQSSQISAIRATLHGGIANSTVRRHPVQQRFLQTVGPQIRVIKLAGYLFFGTVVGVEKQIRALLLDEALSSQPIQFLVVDLAKVDGIDYSAAEAFLRLNRILKTKNVKLFMCGFALRNDIGQSLENVGLLNTDGGVDTFENLNSSLEYCENDLLKTFYRRRDALEEDPLNHQYLDIPQQKSTLLSGDELFSSPRRNQLEEVAATALREHHRTIPHAKWQPYQQPLKLILHAFSTVSDKDEYFWRRATDLFERRCFAIGTVLYRRGDQPDAFYILESGMLRADYKLPQGNYSELIVAGTTCGELPFFSQNPRTSTTSADSDCVTWMLTGETWSSVKKNQPDIAQELLEISLKLTEERLDAITKHMLLISS